MPLTVDEVVTIDVGAAGSRSEPTSCRLRVYEWIAGRASVVIVSELAQNQGLSVTNAAEQIWRAVAQRLDTARFTLIEHYGPDASAGAMRHHETFDVVTVDPAGHPSWRSISRREVRALTGESGWL